jgi:LacI family transcriptional regulator
MRRPTIPDLATAAGVSVATVNRVINGAEGVRKPTRDRVLIAAEEIGFYGLGSIEYSVRRSREKHRLGILLQQGGRTFYRNLGEALVRQARLHPDCTVDLTLEYMDDLSPEKLPAGWSPLAQPANPWPSSPRNIRSSPMRSMPSWPRAYL